MSRASCLVPQVHRPSPLLPLACFRSYLLPFWLIPLAFMGSYFVSLNHLNHCRRRRRGSEWEGGKCNGGRPPRSRGGSSSWWNQRTRGRGGSDGRVHQQHGVGQKLGPHRQRLWRHWRHWRQGSVTNWAVGVSCRRLKHFSYAINALQYGFLKSRSTLSSIGVSRGHSPPAPSRAHLPTRTRSHIMRRRTWGALRPRPRWHWRSISVMRSCGALMNKGAPMNTSLPSL
jgi:hypothetical protein